MVIKEYQIFKKFKSRLDQGDEKKDAIQITNQIYKNKYGRNKIFTK